MRFEEMKQRGFLCMGTAKSAEKYVFSSPESSAELSKTNGLLRKKATTGETAEFLEKQEGRLVFTNRSSSKLLE